MKKNALLFSAVAIILSLPSAGFGASILTFQGLGLSNDDPIPGTYGDRLVETPNVVVDYHSRAIATGEPASDYLKYWSTGVGDLVDVAYSPETAGFSAEITLIADPGWEVVLHSFDLGGYPARDYLNQPVFVVEGTNGAILADFSGTVLGAGPSHSSYNVNIARNALTIRWGDNFNVGIDNVNFSQQLATPVPEPSSLALCGLGAMIVGYRGWRRRTK